MPTHKSRPPAEVTIADSASCTIVRNPSPRCPHGLFYREASWQTYELAIREQTCQAPECEATEYAIHAGESVTVRSARSIGERLTLADRVQAALEAAQAEVALATTEKREATVDPLAEGMAAQREVLIERITAWTWTDADGAPMPLPSDDPEYFRRNVELTELLWLWNVVLRGADPRVTVTESGNGSAA